MERSKAYWFDRQKVLLRKMGAKMDKELETRCIHLDEEVSFEKIGRYSSVNVEKIRNKVFNVLDMIEKPGKDEILSKYAIFGRCVLPCKIFSVLKTMKKEIGKELQLTDAMRILAKEDGMVAVDYEGKHYDMGSKIGVLKANVEYAFLNAEVRDEFFTYLKDFMKEYDK